MMITEDRVAHANAPTDSVVLPLARTLDSRVGITQVIKMRDVDDHDAIFEITATVRDADVLPHHYAPLIRETLMVWYRAARLLKRGETAETDSRFLERKEFLKTPAVYSQPLVTMSGLVPVQGSGFMRISANESTTVQEVLDTVSALVLARDSAIEGFAKALPGVEVFL